MNRDTNRKTGVPEKEKLAIDGGIPVRREPLPLEFPGIHYMDEEEINAALRVLRSRSPFRYYGVDLQGRSVQAFETEFASFLGIAHCLATNSGTGALHIALAALGVGPGQEIIVPAYLWVSRSGGCRQSGGHPCARRYRRYLLHGSG